MSHSSAISAMQDESTHLTPPHPPPLASYLMHHLQSMAQFPPPQLRTSSTGIVFLPSFPSYARSLLKSQRIYLSAANSSLLHYSLYFYFRQEKTKSLHFLHLLYTKCLYVRIRQEERRRAEAEAQTPKLNDEEEEKQTRSEPRPVQSITTDSATSTTTTATPSPATSAPIAHAPHPHNDVHHTHPHPHHSPSTSIHRPPDAEDLLQRLHSMELTIPSRSRHGSRTSSRRSSNATSVSPTRTNSNHRSAIVSASPVDSSGPSASPETNGSGPPLRHPSTVGTLTSTGAQSLSYPFSKFFEMYAAFAEAAVRSYTSVYWLQQEYFLQANADRRRRPNEAATDADSMMKHQHALSSSLRIDPEYHGYGAENENDELEILDILRSDRDLLHFPIDWPTLLELTHDSYMQHLAELQRAHEAQTQLRHSTEWNVVGGVRPLQSIITPDPAHPSPAPITPSALPSSHPPTSVGDVVLQALQVWRYQKAAQRRLERARMTQEERKAELDDICYVPLSARHTLEQPIEEMKPTLVNNRPSNIIVPPNSASSSSNLSLHPSSASAKRRWHALRSEFHRRRLLKVLHTQREFYLALAKHKVLTYRPPHVQRNVSASPVGSSKDTLSLSPPTPQQHSSTLNNALHQSLSMPNISQYSNDLVELSTVTPKLPPPPLSPIRSPNGATSISSFGSPQSVISIDESPPRRPIIIFLAGGMSAGKSTVLKHLRAAGDLFGISDDAVLVESDKFKLVDPLYQSLPATDVARSQFVHSQSLITAEETLLAAVRDRRDVIVDGTMSWRPYIEQTIAMIRHSHQKQFKRGRGHFHPDTGEIIEEYWIECLECDPPPPTPSQPLPYVVCMLGVTVHWSVAVSRAIRRAVAIGRSVPIDALLGSYVKFATHFDYYITLMDAYSLLDNSDDEMRVLTEVTSPTRILSKGLDQATHQIASPQLYGMFQQQKHLPTDVADAAEMERKLAEIESTSSSPRNFSTAPPPPASSSPASLSSVHAASFTRLIPSSFRWLVSQVSGDDDIITEDEMDEDELAPTGTPV